jgi:chorismate-pyruvate lyase
MPRMMEIMADVKPSVDIVTPARLGEGFPEVEEGQVVARPIRKEDLPEECRGLLVHEEHMTARLRAYHGAPVELRVLREQRTGDVYRRLILLVLQGTLRVVEVGICRVRLHHLPGGAAAEVLERRRPLGDILIRHEVLRRVEPRSYWRFPADHGLSRLFGGEGAAHGRIGVIHCNGDEAVEVLEVVRPEEDSLG